MIKAAQTASAQVASALTASARPVETALAGAAPDDRRPKLQALAAPAVARRANWQLRALGAPAFELASARG